MVMAHLRLMAWTALVLMRDPLRAFFSGMAFLSLLMIFAGAVTLPFGGVGGNPIWAQSIAVLILLAAFAVWSRFAFYYDTLVFNLTPKDREVILSD